MLKEVLLNPRAARYPFILKFVSWEIEWNEGMGYSRGMVPESDLVLFKQAARGVVDAPEKKLEEDWLTEIDKGDEEPLIALLLRLLPNLREVKLDSDLCSTCICDTLRDIGDNDNSSSLRKLQPVGLRFEATRSDHDFIDFDYV